MNITKARGLPMIIARGCLAEAIRRGEVAYCSGKAEDMRKGFEQRICDAYYIDDWHKSASRPAVNFEIWRDSQGQARVMIPDAHNPVFDHVIGDSEARQLEERYRMIQRPVAKRPVFAG